MSATARDQSIFPAAFSLARRTAWSLSHTPASFQSRSRLQQLIPDPHPISAGRYSHGLPVFSTNRIPVSACRSEIGSRPIGTPRRLRRGSRFGSRGSISPHNLSSNTGLAMAGSFPTHNPMPASWLSLAVNC